jgi:hypothetical protein
MSESCRREEKKPISTSAVEVEVEGDNNNLNERIDPSGFFGGTLVPHT